MLLIPQTIGHLYKHFNVVDFSIGSAHHLIGVDFLSRDPTVFELIRSNMEEYFTHSIEMCANCMSRLE